MDVWGILLQELPPTPAPLPAPPHTQLVTAKLWRWRREGGSAGMGWRDGEKRHTTVIE